jgi:hypothetical protein
MFQFTIRDVLWLTVVVGLICWASLERRSRAVMEYRLEFSKAHLEALVNLIQAEGYQVEVQQSGVSITKGNETRAEIGIGH